MSDDALRQAAHAMLEAVHVLEDAGVESVDAWNDAVDGMRRAKVALSDALAAQEPVQPVADKIARWQPGRWFKAASVEEMEAFYLSRLPAIREAARELGYAIGLHGSLKRDMDLIAAPWREGAADADTLAHAVQKAACGMSMDGPYQWTAKPLGRIAVSMPCCWTWRRGVTNDGHIDLSVMPAAHPVAQAVQPVAWTLRETLEKRDTTFRAPLWFSNPENSGWVPLYAAPQPPEYGWSSDSGVSWSQHLRNRAAKLLERANKLDGLGVEAAPQPPAMQPLKVRWTPVEGQTFNEMRDAVRQHPLFNIGDTILVWVNEGDIHMLGERIGAQGEQA